ncbi:MAG TPA: hypothetical protein VKU94_03225 [Geobacterales bacterium]|nr:hypothetical protein [Geobacterales bacterium]
MLKYILSDDAKYAIYTELVNLYDVLDSMVFDREIPHFNPLEVGVKLILDKRVYHRFDTLRYVVINLGYPTVCFGSSYKIYYYNGTDWILANWLMGFFTLELHCIGTFGYWQGSLYLNGTMHGKYLLVKEIILEPNDYRLLLSEEFEVIE